MHNRTGNQMRFKVKKPRQTNYQLSQHLDYRKEVDQSSTSNNTKRFSSQYLSIAKKFKIKMVGNQRKRDLSVAHLDRNRVKTEMSKDKDRYSRHPLNLLEYRPHSEFINEDNKGSETARSNRLALFNLNKNTVYHDGTLRWRSQFQLEPTFEEESIKLAIGNDDSVLVELGKHCKKMWEIKQSLQRQSLNTLEVIRELKLYVMRDDKHSISRIDRYVEGQSLKRQLKQLVMLERMVLLSMVANIASNHIFQMLQQSNRALEIILGFWYQVINNTYSNNIYKLQITQQSEIKDILTLLAQAKLLTKNSLKLLIETVLHKLPLLFKYCKQLYVKLKLLINQAQQMTINRAFYQALTIFATYLADYQRRHKINLDNIAFFATCPSPYLVKPSTKAYSLVVDLDQTLLYSVQKNNPKGKSQDDLVTLYRPGCYDFIEELSEYYQIIVFTTSMESYAREVTKKFNGIDHFLFRQHAVRMKHGLVKDLSRIGRNLNKVIILDDTSSNFRYQRDNGIRVKAWRGEPNDTELESLKEMLLNLVRSNTEDVKTNLSTYKEEISRRASIPPFELSKIDE